MGIFDFLDPIQQAIEEWLINIGVTVPPWSALFLIIVSLLISSLTGALNRTLLDMEKLESQTNEMQELQKQKKKAMETADKKLWIQVKRNEDRMLELQKNTTFSRMLPSLITIGPFIFVFQTLRQAFQGAENCALNQYVVEGSQICDINQRHGALVVLPFNMHDLPLLGGWFSPYAGDPSISVAGFSFWYFLSAIVVSTLFQRLFGINITGMRNPTQGGLGR
jgi:uncharacterized membrane protein (DUF106 family)